MGTQLISSDKRPPNYSTYILAPHPHLVVRSTAILWRHLQFDVELAVGQIDLGRHLASLQINHVRGRVAAARLVPRLEQIQVQVLVREPVPLVRLQCEFLRSAKERC